MFFFFFFNVRLLLFTIHFKGKKKTSYQIIMNCSNDPHFFLLLWCQPENQFLCLFCQKICTEWQITFNKTTELTKAKLLAAKLKSVKRGWSISDLTFWNLISSFNSFCIFYFACNYWSNLILFSCSTFNWWIESKIMEILN